MRYLVAFFLLLLLSAQSLALAAGQSCDRNSEPGEPVASHHLTSMSAHGDMPCCAGDDTGSADIAASLCQLVCQTGSCFSGAFALAPAPTGADWPAVASTLTSPAFSIATPPTSALFRPPIAG
ncbi:hypothetical protein [Microbulbifer sp. TYP-18]|uniref:hypothetical protein n=1 Tax=Microbulbifer sp. TYP-18 TaxID=3230024 RepID=UPI0034C6B0C9